MVLSITSNMMQPVFGYVMDRHNLSRILIPVILFGAICICSIGLISTKAMLFIIIALTGLSVSAFHPLGSTLVAKTAPSERQGRSMSYYIAGGNLGYALAPIIVIAFLDRFSMAELPWLMVPAFLFAFVCLKSGLRTRFSTVAEQAKGKVFTCAKSSTTLPSCVSTSRWACAAARTSRCRRSCPCCSSATATRASCRARS